MNSRLRLAAITAVSASLALAACAEEDSPAAGQEEASFKAERVTLLVPVPPGASFDTFARAVAPHLGEELGVDILVENRPGASGLVALNEMAQTEPDGSTIALWQMGPVAIAQLQGIEQVQFDVAELSYIGNFADADHMLFVHQNSDIQSIEDLRAAKNFAFASGELGSLGYTSQQVVDRLFSLNAEFITGYADQGERLAAIERGDADGVIGPVRTYESIGRLDDVRPILRLANQRHAEFPEVPTALELEGLSEQDQELLQTHFDMASLFFTVVGPADMPDGVLSELREAFWAVANDEEVLADLNERGLAMAPDEEYLTGEEVQELVPTLLEVPADYQALIDELAQE
ncbi:Bug family tripartite tricarboxylate transporter substrate binding protein [Georgenia sp. AZ-5]|uniref:Bug family tripartite tricarboxylate transporter substrate binding protein n=1 Tax=Georgenia sp. AZ-5 TaxID=3367526 RepID=UPI00375465C8